MQIISYTFQFAIFIVLFSTNFNLCAQNHISAGFSDGIYPENKSKSTLGLFTNHIDIGNPKLAGAATFDETTKSYQLTGAGYNIWFNRDEFHYLYNQIEGDFILTAKFELTGAASDPLRKVGWMIRASLDDKACHASAVVHGDGLTLLQWRPRKGARMKSPQHELYAPNKNYQLLQLERSGQQLIMRAAQKGGPLQTIGSHTMPKLPSTVFAGLCICSHQPEVKAEARIWDVEIEPLE